MKRRSVHFAFTRKELLVVIAVLGLLAALLVPRLQISREAARRATSMDKMQQIARAMHAYAQTHNTLPPAYQADNNGKSLLSWRVLILPYLKADKLYEQFHLDEPWDSEHNKKMIAQMPAVYRSPGSNDSSLGKTNYLTVRGKDTLFSGGKGTPFDKAGGRIAHTIMTVEVADPNAVVWTRPDDLTYAPQTHLQGVVGLRPGGFLAGFGDCSVRFIASTIDARVLVAEFVYRGKGDAGNPAPASNRSIPTH
jgi:type II secretory pathway pseudopilin PulG